MKKNGIADCGYTGGADTGPAVPGRRIFWNTIRGLLAAARHSKTEVIYVRHNSPGSVLAANSAGWNIHAPIAPPPLREDIR